MNSTFKGRRAWLLSFAISFIINIPVILLHVKDFTRSLLPILDIHIQIILSTIYTVLAINLFFGRKNSPNLEFFLKLFLLGLAYSFSLIWLNMTVVKLGREMIPSVVIRALLLPVFAKIYVLYFEQQDTNKSGKIALEELNEKLRYTELHNQLSPHFLFNSLNSIYSLAIQKKDETPESILAVSQYIQHILKHKDEGCISFSEELNFLKNYLYLQKVKLGDDLYLETHFPEAAPDLVITPFILINLIENMFKHGVNPQGKSHLIIDMNLDKNILRLYLKNNNFQKVDSTMIGLNGSRALLELYYKDTFSLETEKDNSHFIQKLVLPLKKQEKP
ncbi:histidine kinase [Marinilongibacter aquaticus]|uniref:sensor histidine kinase n=1 Tax=Marinilongibacter aquaticus TaxID=2975157 RepID=UPI0021BDB16B|nr:sensor histidine kinase [Marinilongibacter aquaticus]UBM58659.1 histidine kinase [Marinilongibacter aquaticus]